MTTLLFPLSDVLIVADHAVAAPHHKSSFADSLDGTTPAPALWLVGDDGLYLMSNGLPQQPHPDGGDRLHLVYADGYHTAMSKRAIAIEIGGDDFCVPLPLLTVGPDDATLHARLTAALLNGQDLFVVDIDQTSVQFYAADSRDITA